MADTTISGIETVSAEELIKAWGANPYKAQKTYQGRTFKLCGEIYNITNKNGVPLIEFPPYAITSGYAQVYCYLSVDDPMLADVEAGGNVAIQGCISEVDTGRPYPAYKVTDCKIISAN